MIDVKVRYWLLATGVLTLGLAPAAQALTPGQDAEDGSGTVTAAPTRLVQRETATLSDAPVETAEDPAAGEAAAVFSPAEAARPVSE